jgi:hypothetical protein
MSRLCEMADLVEQQILADTPRAIASVVDGDGVNLAGVTKVSAEVVGLLLKMLPPLPFAGHAKHRSHLAPTKVKAVEMTAAKASMSTPQYSFD